MSQANQWIHLDPEIQATFAGEPGARLVAACTSGLRFVDAPAAGSYSTQLELAGGSCFALELELDQDGLGKPSPKDLESFASLLASLRKEQHIHISTRQDVEAIDRYTGFEELVLRPCALPTIDPDDLNTEAELFGRRFRLPFLITGMTGGIERGVSINHNLARAAAKYGIPMGIGSQRMALEDPSLAKVFQVKDVEPDLFLIANLGIAQLCDADALELCRRAVSMIDADALAIHLNVVQELVQVEGNRTFAKAWRQLERLPNALNVPIMIKEVGCGIDPATASRLAEIGFRTVDVGGKGGTSWPYIEGLRSRESTTRQLGACYRDWGIPTAHAVAAVLQSVPELDVVATGGIRSGLDAAKACALGASMVGIGLPLMKAAVQSEEAVCEVLGEFEQGLQLAMIASNSATLDALQTALSWGNPYISFLKERCEELGRS